MTTRNSAHHAPSNTRSNVLARHPLLAFFTLAILTSWIISLPAFLFEMPFKPFQIAGAFGPSLAAVIVSVAMGRDELRLLFNRMTNFSFRPGWYLLAIFGNALLYLLVAGLSGAPLLPSLADKGSLIFTLYLPTLFTSFLVNPIGEETGWTGFALPHLQNRFKPWLSAIILGVFWAVWHLPGFFIPREMGPFNPANFLFFMLSCVLTRVIWTWITNNAHGSGLSGVLLHASSNAVSLSLIPNLLPIPEPDQLAISGLFLFGCMLILTLLILVFTRGQLSREHV